MTINQEEFAGQMESLLVDPSTVGRLQQTMDRVVSGVFRTMLSMTVTPRVERSIPFPLLCGTVGFAGPHLSGVVYVMMGEGLGRRAASVIFGGAPDQVPDADLEDMVGELANMIAGDFKTGALADLDTCFLSLPSVVRSAELSIECRDSNVRLDTTYAAGPDNETLTVRIHLLLNQGANK